MYISTTGVNETVRAQILLCKATLCVFAYCFECLFVKHENESRKGQEEVRKIDARMEGGGGGGGGEITFFQ